MNFKKQTLALWWAGYLEHAMHPDAPEIQKQEMRKAFYMGAWSFLETLMVLTNSGKMSDDEGSQWLEDRLHELQAFIEETCGEPVPEVVRAGLLTIARDPEKGRA